LFLASSNPGSRRNGAPKVVGGLVDPSHRRKGYTQVVVCGGGIWQ
jgi:hypothetical protein